MNPKLIINMISESAFTIRGHGVHTAFLEMLRGLKARSDTDIEPNTWRPTDITHIHTFGLYGLGQLLFGKGKKVVSVHLVPDSIIGSLAGATYYYGLARFYMKLFYGRADLLLAVSKTVEHTLLTDLKIKKPVYVLYNTVDMAQYATTPANKTAARKTLDLDGVKQVVVSNGQIQPRKRFDLFCAIARQMPDVQFIWIGGIPFKYWGAEHQKMQELIEAKPANVMVTGVIELPQVKQYLQAADVFWLPSDQENHPMAALEAAGAGLPILVRDLPEYNDSFGNDVVRGSDETFDELLHKLLSNKEFRATAVQGAQAIAARFDSHAGADRLMAFYRQLLK